MYHNEFNTINMLARLLFRFYYVLYFFIFVSCTLFWGSSDSERPGNKHIYFIQRYKIKHIK